MTTEDDNDRADLVPVTQVSFAEHARRFALAVTVVAVAWSFTIPADQDFGVRMMMGLGVGVAVGTLPVRAIHGLLSRSAAVVTAVVTIGAPVIAGFLHDDWMWSASALAAAVILGCTGLLAVAHRRQRRKFEALLTQMEEALRQAEEQSKKD